LASLHVTHRSPKQCNIKDCLIDRLAFPFALTATLHPPIVRPCFLS